MLPTLHAISLSLHPRMLVVTALSSILAERLLGEGMRYEKKDRSANGVHTMARGYSPARYLKLERLSSQCSILALLTIALPYTSIGSGASLDRWRQKNWMGMGRLTEAQAT